ncbi:hypothetical protein J3R30DRAFT_3522615 [Lentinula aciculospora]|uniref:Chromatin target of PRMT1 protein C-terminal domain-containing protein n=1 Tax=Lentinula aciculospora TaxID=153920 RepID=A0A9W9DID1_9AGAR|nr:hypothetical protein J3R30DRAFT_3522615 [Lentinula aciculospora]
MDISSTTGLSIAESFEPFNDPSDQSLSYDESIPYEEQLPTGAESALASRIGNTKVYLLSESSAMVIRGGKRKRDAETEETEEVDADVVMDDDPTLRGNALLLHGVPISNLPTARLFAYATHFDAHPMGMEWVDDNTCVFIFTSKSAARTGLRYLSKSFGEEPDPEGYITAKPIPIAFWPPEERINHSLGKAQGHSVMKGVIKMRWARTDDVKKRGAKGDSEFYKKHGQMAGKELFNGRELPVKKRRWNDDEPDAALRKEQLDDDLNEFLAEGEAEDAAGLEPQPPSSKMRSDYIASDGRTLLREPSPKLDLASRIFAPLPRRAQKNRNTNGSGASLEDRVWSNRVVSSGRITSERRTPRRGRNDQHHEGKGKRDGNESRDRPKKSQQELDDELDAFLREE